MPTERAISATSSAVRAACSPSIGTLIISRAKPWKCAKKPAVSFALSVPQIEDQRLRIGLLEIGHRFGEHTPAGLIVRAVEPDFRVRRRAVDEWTGTQPLQARRPFGAREAALENSGRKIGLYSAQGRDRIGGVGVLMAPGEARQRQVDKTEAILEHEPAVFRPDREIALGERQRRADPYRRALDHTQRLWLLGGDDSGRRRLEIPAFSKAILSTVEPRNSG